MNNTCPSYVTLDSAAIEINVTLLDQFGTWVQGGILDNNFSIQLIQSGCDMNATSYNVTVDAATGTATFTNLTFLGKQNDICQLKFQEYTENLATTIQPLNCSIILYGCEPGWGVSTGQVYDSCVPSKYIY